MSRVLDVFLRDRKAGELSATRSAAANDLWLGLAWR